jgi:GAF domain-containing protein
MTSPDARLQLLYDVARSVTTFTQLDPLLRFATRRARELLEAEGCAVLLLDDSRRELYFPVASQVESREATAVRLEAIRFPARLGVAGWVLEHDEPVLVDDVASDPRFYAGVDRATATSTRTILCAPLRTPGGNIGVVEVINPLRGRFEAGDLAFLEALAADIAIACEKAQLYERLRGETVALRQAIQSAGLGLAVLGVVFALGGTYAHLAWALPLTELPTRPAILTAIVLLALGGGLTAIARGWLVRAAEPASPRDPKAHPRP